ncbi:mobilome CxxCx(11)CxxC protein [Chryseobacterium sp. 7]|uniref:mobilome CxxCx(11)CxxC protein n=1 Tax=Chryseobacterium sp. 7 TaxID=2035214 RepID=UPI000EB2C174|nr:mobilome CxxCx(11)CxxC protein [Chryseobacterium sp. 7]RLJ33809.1 mobilome CxxCx(11)CxxC protein [Chryseobacterium sp. 7]
MTPEEQLRVDSWDNSIQTFGKSYIFSKRAQFYSNWNRFLAILGIVVPLTIGATASGYGFNSEILKNTIAISIPLSIIQLIISAFALVNNWNDNLSYSLEAVNDYNSLSDNFKKLGKNPPNSFEEFSRTFEILETKMSSRADNDAKYSLKERELRKGMRYALREFQRQCVGCNKVPLSISSTDCEVCGKFERSLIHKILFHG